MPLIERGIPNRRSGVSVDLQNFPFLANDPTPAERTARRVWYHTYLLLCGIVFEEIKNNYPNAPSRKKRETVVFGEKRGPIKSAPHGPEEKKSL